MNTLKASYDSFCANVREGDDILVCSMLHRDKCMVCAHTRKCVICVNGGRVSAVIIERCWREIFETTSDRINSFFILMFGVGRGLHR